MSAVPQSGPSSKKRAANVDVESKQRKVQKVHPFFTQSFKDKPPSSFHWHKPLGPKGTCLHGTNLTPASSTKVATFDLDGTLIKSSFGKGVTKKKAPKDAPPAWEWWREKVPATLQELHSDGYSIVIISNQALRGAQITTWKEKVSLIAAALPSLPFRIFAATSKDQYRKPMTGMWTELAHIFRNDGIEIDKSASFFVGDAAGRPDDFASTDRKWALNVGIPFHTPEEYFLKIPPQNNFSLDGFNVANLPELPPFIPTHVPVIPKPRIQEIVIFVGYPSLGKSSLYRRLFAPLDYQHVNQDILGTRAKCIKKVEEALKEGISVVIDNTNRDAQTRKYYIDLAQKHKVPIRCFLFTGSMELAWHNNLYRAFNLPPAVAAREEQREALPYLAFTSFKSNYEEPRMSEGFSEIMQVNWLFEGTEEERKYWSMWLQV